MKVTRQRKGVVAEFEGGFWGIEYEDGHSAAMAFGPIEKAHLADPEYCRVPTDMTYTGSPDVKLLERARLVPVTITTTYDVEEEGEGGTP